MLSPDGQLKFTTGRAVPCWQAAAGPRLEAATEGTGPLLPVLSPLLALIRGRAASAVPAAQPWPAAARAAWRCGTHTLLLLAPRCPTDLQNTYSRLCESARCLGRANKWCCDRYKRQDTLTAVTGEKPCRILSFGTWCIGTSTQIKHRTNDKEAFMQLFLLKLYVCLYIGVI